MTNLLLGQNYSVGSAVTDALEEAGVAIVFGMDDPQGLWCPVRRSGIRTAIFHDERGGGFAATGYTLATGQLSVCTGITGPGAMNLTTALLEARKSSIPILAVIGEANPARPDLHAFQTAPHGEVLGPLSKATIRIDRPSDAHAAVHRAISIATSGRPGPVALIVGDDLLWEDGDPASALAANGGPPAATSSTSFPAVQAAGAAELVSAAHSLLTEARRPVLVAGGGVVLAGATAELEAVAEKYQVPVVTTLVGKGALPDTHPLALGVGSSYTGGAHGRGELANRHLADADLILVVGSDLDPLTTSSGMWPRPSTRLIRVDIDPEELVTQGGMQIHGDAREVLRQLWQDMPSVERDSDYLDWVTGVTREAAQRRADVARFDREQAVDGFVWPGAVMQELSDALGEGDAIVTDASFVSSWAIDRVVQPFAGRYVFGPRGSGVLGWGLPGALGVKLARPSTRVTCVTGDGGLYYSIGELESALRLNAPLTLVLLNNGSLGFQRQSDRLHQGEDYDDLRFAADVDFVKLAEGFGWRGARVGDASAFAESYAEAQASEQPTLIDVATHPDVHPPITKFDDLPQ
jgi:acetolactate synthase I/II/III large subunit